MRDDEYIEITWSDLSLEAPTARATLYCQLVQEEEVAPSLDSDRLSPAGFEPPAAPLPRSSRNMALTTLFLGVTVCLIAGVAWGFGLSATAALIAGFGGTVGSYLLIHFTSARPRR